MAFWNVYSRIGFRFCLLYFGLFCLSCQIVGGLFPIPIEGVNVPDLSTPMRPLVFWTAAHVFHAKLPLVFEGSGSGDKTFDWVLTFCVLMIAVAGTCLWSILDRKRGDYGRLAQWCYLVLRFAVAGQMISYGFAKAVPLQMPFPYLTKLLEPYGNFSPMGVLWSSVGASPSYEIFIGLVEIVSGVLLIFPRTTMLGALLCLMDSVEIFTLNMTYDIPVKLFAFHLILLSVCLLAPDLKRIVSFLVFNRAVAASVVKAGRVALIFQLVFGLWLLGNNAYGARQAWYEYGGGRTRSALYGIWDLEEMSIDNQIRAPLVTDYGRWRRAIFDSKDGMSFQRMDGTLAGFGAAVNLDKKTIGLTKYDDKKWKGELRFERKAAGEMTFSGKMDGHAIYMKLKAMERSQFLLVSRGFNWVQEYPFNR